MRMTQIKRQPFGSNSIVCPKSRTSIPLQSRLHRDVLVQASLDPLVRIIEFLPEIRFRGISVALDSTVLHRDDGSFMLRIEGHRSVRNEHEEGAMRSALRQRGISILDITTAEIRVEPRLTNAREVWACRDFHVTMADRMRILHALEDEGPQSIKALQHVACTSADLASALCSLACADLVEIDIAAMPIGPATIVRSRK
jgi:hypothetical protein